MEITNKKSVYQDIYLISNFIKIIKIYILTSIIMKITQDIIRICIYFYIIHHENKLGYYKHR